MAETRHQTQDSFAQASAGPGTQRDASSRQSKRRSRNWKSIAGIAGLGACALVVLVLLYAFVYRSFIDPPVEPEIVQGGKSHVIQLDVLNGTGMPKLGRRFTDYLRARGFDVVEMGNYKETGVPLTRVVDRAGNLQAALQVAHALGVPKERVAQDIDRNLYLDVTVVIGKDFRSLKPMQ